MGLQSNKKSLELFFHHLQSSLGGDFLPLMDELDIKPDQRGSALPLMKLFQLSNRLNITMDSIYHHQIDFTVLKAQFEGRDLLPQRYLGTELSSRFSGMYMFNFLRQNFGEASAKLVLQRFQLRDHHFEDMTETNNILLPGDLCDYVKDYHGMESVEKMGESSLALLKRSGIGRNLKSFAKGDDFFEFFFNELLPGTVEKNYKWNIEKQGSGFLEVKGCANPEIIEGLGHQRVITSSLETLRKGFLKSVPKLYFDCPVEIRQHRSMKGGDDYDLYRIEYLQDHKSPPYLH